jgi:predicted ATPase
MATTDIKETDDEITVNTKPPFLRRVRIRGYKSIAFCDVTLAPLTVLVGRNASGKSNFLDALAFLGDVVRLGVNEAVTKHGGADIIPNKLLDDRKVVIEIEFAYEISDGNDSNVMNGTYGITVTLPKRLPPEILHESLNVRGWLGYKNYHGRVICFATDDETQERAWRIYDRPFLDAYNDTPVPEFSDCLEKIVVFGPQPDQIRRLQKRNPASWLRRDASNLAGAVRSLREFEPMAFERMKEYVSHITEEVTDFWDQSYGEYETVRFRMRPTHGDKPLEFDAESMSDGTLRVLANIMAVFQNVPPYGHPSVVGIEEPETALHPAAMNALVDALDEATTRTQILLTTHSAELLDNPTIKPENVRVVQKIDGQTVIGPVDDASVEIVRQKLNTLGGLERDNLLEPDLDDLERQKHLQNGRQELQT